MTAPGGVWSTRLGTESELRAVALAQAPHPADGVDLHKIEVRLAGLAAVMDEPALRNRSLIVSTNLATAAAIGTVRDRGYVEVPLDDGRRVFPVDGMPLTPGFWLIAQGVARAVRDDAALSALAVPALLARIGELGDGFWTGIAPAFLAPGAETVAAAREALSDVGRTVAEPGYLPAIIRPLLALAEAAAGNDQAAFDTALDAAVRGHVQWYRDEDRRRNPLGLLAFPVLGLAALAHDRGFEVRAESRVLPLDLVRGEVRQSLGLVRYHYPRARLHRSEEANWFLDLEGFPRAGRTHVLQEVHGRLMATYTARGGPGLAEAVLSVEPPPAGEGLADLLDVGELVLAADLLAARAEEDGARRRAWLSEAADCLAEARSRPEPRFAHPRGEAAFRAEPGRFDPERLAAVEGAWREMIREGDAGAARAEAVLSIGALRVQVEPILRAVAADRTGAALVALRPREDDYAKVFAAPMVEVARQRYEALWSAGVGFRRPVGRTRIRISVAPAGALADDNELSRAFPGGYRSVAGLLVPERVWVTWQYRSPGQSTGISYDGLVWCDDHWAFFPKPYRELTTD